MTTRSVLVQLRADAAEFIREMNEATKATRKVGEETEKTRAAAKGALGQMARSASEHGEAWKRTGATVTAAGAAILSVVGLIVKANTEFDVAMGAVAADTRLTGQALGELRTAAMDAGAATSFSAVEAAQGIDELAKAGVSSADILNGGLDGALALAAAGSLDVAEAAETAATAMVQFRLAGDQVGHVADLLAAGAGKAQGSVHQMGMALKQGGLVAAQMGMSVEDTTGTLTAFAAAGLLGSDSGTSLKTMLLMLANPTEKSSKLMSELGISAYDTAGQFVGVTDLAGQLQTKLSGLTQQQRDSALATIFGSDAIRAANVLYQNGATGIQGWIDQTNDAGYAAENAAIKLDTLAGDWEYFTGDLNSLALESGGGLNQTLRGLVQGLDGIVTAFSALPTPVLEAALQLAAVGGAGLVAVGAFLLLAPGIIQTIAAMRALAASNSVAAGNLTAVGKAAGVAMGGLVLLAGASALYKATTTSTNTSLAGTTKALLEMGKTTASVDAIIKATSNTNDRFTMWNGLADAAKQLTDPSLADRINDFGGEILSLGASEGSSGRDALIKQLGMIGEALAGEVNSGNAALAAEQMAQLEKEWVKGGGTVEELRKLMPGYQDALDDVANKQQTAAASGDELATAVTGVAAPTEDAAVAVKQLSDGLDSLLAQFFSVDQASDAFQSSLLGLADAVKKNGTATEGNTEKAIANREALRGTAEDAAKVIQKMAEQGFSSDELSAKAQELKKNFEDQARALGLSGAEVDKVRSAYDAMPRQVKIALVAEGLDGLAERAQQITDRLNAIPRKVQITVAQTTSYLRQEGAMASRAPITRADGGRVPLGLGGPREDNVPAWLSSGEFVVNARDTAKHLPLLEAMNAGKFADGGRVGATAAGTTVSAGYLMGALTATAGAVGDDRYVAALRASTLAAFDADAAEKRLQLTRDRSAAGLDALRDRLDAQLQAQKDAADAAEQAASDRVSQLRDSKASDAAIKAAQTEQTELKRRNAVATRELKDANDAAIKSGKKAADDAETQAEMRLTFAKDQAAAATKELTDAEKELADARADALQLAQSIAGSLLRGAGLTTLWGDTTERTLRSTAAALTDAARAADDANVAVAGESSAQAMERRTAALGALADAGVAYAAAQTAIGVDAPTVEAGLQGIREKVGELADAYGLTGTAVDTLTGKLKSQQRTGAELLASMQRELARTQELSADVQLLQSRGLDAGLLDQVIAAGTTGGGLDIARAILSGDAGLISGLNDTQSMLTAAANGLGTVVSGSRYAPGYTAPSVSASPAGGAVLATLDPTSLQAIMGLGLAVANRPQFLDVVQAQRALAVQSAQTAYRSAQG